MTATTKWTSKRTLIIQLLKSRYRCWNFNRLLATYCYSVSVGPRFKIDKKTHKSWYIPHTSLLSFKRYTVNNADGQTAEAF